MIVFQTRRRLLHVSTEVQAKIQARRFRLHLQKYCMMKGPRTVEEFD